MFLNPLSYRPHNLDDAQTLLDLYITQAQARTATQDYTLGTDDRHGQRFTIVIEVRGQQILTGWILDDQGILKLAALPDSSSKVTYHAPRTQQPR